MRGTWSLQDACFKGAFTELWRPQRSLYRAVEAMNTVVSVTTAVCQGPLALPITFPKFPRTGFFVSLRNTSQSSPSPHSGIIFFLHSFPSCQWPTLYLLLLLFSCPLSPQPQPHCLHARDSVTHWSLQVHGPPLLYSKAKRYNPQGNTTVVWLEPDTEKTTPQESFPSTNPKEIFRACWNSTSDKYI